MKIKCPYCGFEGEPKDYYLLYEAVVNVALFKPMEEGRERPPLLICPKCGKAFPSGEFYGKVKEKLRKQRIS